MSDFGIDLDRERRHRHRRGFGCLAVLLALAVLVGGGFAAYSYGLSALKERLSPPPGLRRPRHRPGARRGQERRQSSADIGRDLKAKDVVKSVEAFTDAARDDDRSRRHPGRASTS